MSSALRSGTRACTAFLFALWLSVGILPAAASSVEITRAGQAPAVADEGDLVVVSTAMTWDEARLYAQTTYNGELASIADAAANAEVLAAALQAVGASPFWIGFSDTASEGNFVWSDGSAVTYANWAGGEPNDAGGEDCTQMLPSGEWNDMPCGTSLPFVVVAGPQGDIAGSVVDADGDELSGVDVALSGGHHATTDAHGAYLFEDVDAGTYTVMPSLSNYTFVPVERHVTVEDDDVTGQDFVGYTPLTVSLTSPTNGASNRPLEQAFSWSYNTATADSAIFYLDDDDDPATEPLFSDTLRDGTTTSFAQTVAHLGLDLETTYYWQVVVYRESPAFGHEVETSSIYHYATFSGSEPFLSHPTHGDRLWDPTANFNWYIVTGAEGLSWDVEFKEPGTVGWHHSDILHTATVHDTDPVEGGRTYPMPDDVLLHGRQYTWRVVARDGGLAVGVSDEATFDVVGGEDEVIPALNYPADGATVFTTTPEFAWSTSDPGGPIFFDVEVKPEHVAGWDEAHLVAFVRDLDATTWTPAEDLLMGDATYTWRVLAHLEDGQVGVSEEATFTVQDNEGGAIQPIISWPTGGATVYTLSPTLRWYITLPATGLTYEVELRDVTDGEVFDGTADFSVVDGREIDLAHEGVTLEAGHTYAWQVRTTNGAQTSAWSAEATFVTAGGTAATAATLSYPTGGVTVYNSTTTLYWWIGGPTDGLTFTVTLTPDGGAPVVYGPTSATQQTVSGLMPGETYTWSVTTSDGDTEVDSAPATFTLYDSAEEAGTAVASWPVGGGPPVVYSRTPTFSWWVQGSRSGLDGFQIQWSQDADFHTDVFTHDVGDAHAASYTLTEHQGLLWGETYYWRVGAVAHGESDPTTWSEGAFTVTGADGSLVPIASYPTGGAVVYADEATLSWYVSADASPVVSYDVQFGTASDFHGATLVEDHPASPFTTPALTPGATYHWRVRANLSDGTQTVWSVPAASFVMDDADAAAVVPRVGSPVAGVTVMTAAPDLSWSVPVGDAAAMTYEVELSASPDFEDAVRVEDVAALHTAMEGLEAGTYHWRVRSLRDGTPSLYSEAGSFRVDASVVSSDEPEGPVDEVSLAQSVPNPASGALRIGYVVPETGAVRLSVYDVLGRRVAVLVDADVAAGTHEVAWDGRDASGQPVASGTYVYRLEAGGTLLTRTLVLLR